MSILKKFTSAFISLLVVGSLPAMANDTKISPEDSSEDDTFASFEVIGENELDSNRGAFIVNGETVGITISDGFVNQNAVGDNTVTGNNNLADTAFDSASGVVTLIQNTGNNVLIQNSTVVNYTQAQ